MTMNQLTIAAFVVLGAAFVVVALASSWLLSPKAPSVAKGETYESGLETIGPAWVQFRPGYYVYAVLFVIFDVETVFLYPWAVAFDRVGLYILVEMVLFLGVLVGGLLYAWKEGALRWR